MPLSRTALIPSNSPARYALGILQQIVSCRCCGFHSILPESLNDIAAPGAGGVIFGWPSLQRILESEGVFAQKCPGVPVTDCDAASIKYNTIFTAGAVGATGGMLFFGYLFDRFGPRVSSVVGHLMMLTGVLMFAFSSNSCKLSKKM